MACKSCGKTRTTFDATTAQNATLILYTSPNLARHRVVVIDDTTITEYGRRKGGEEFLVHTHHVELNKYFEPVNLDAEFAIEVQGLQLASEPTDAVLELEPEMPQVIKAQVPVSEIDIDKFELPARQENRVKNTLREAGYTTLDKYNEIDLVSLKGIGVKVAASLIEQANAQIAYNQEA